MKNLRIKYLAMNDLAKIDELAKVYYKNLDYENALVCYAEAFARYPYLGLAYSNYGKILAEMGHPELAIPFVELGIKLMPEDSNAPMNLAYSVLLSGDLNRGFKEFECRWKFKQHEHVLNSYSKPRWEGEAIHNKTILVTCEEGDGDNIQFIRYVSLINTNVIIQTEPQLKRLFKSSYPNCIVIDNKEPIPDYDYWIPILSLPRIFNISYDNFPAINNYIKPSKESIKKWKKIIKSSNKVRIGICYRGRTKKYPFENIFKMIENNPEYEFISIQGIYQDTEFDKLSELGVKTYINDINDWDDTAALIQHLDYIISIDTGLIHLAGSLGVKTILLNDHYAGCWRWLLNRSDSPWYPSVTIVRQETVHGYDQQLENAINVIKWK